MQIKNNDKYMSEIKYFRPINKDGESFGVWSFDGKTALRIGVPNPMDSPNSHAVVKSGQTLFEAMKCQLKAFFQHGAPCVLKDMALKPGQYYPRIARPTDQHPKDIPNYPEPKPYEHEIAISKGQLVSLMSRLQQICQTIHPTTETFNSYGHEIRNLLILACTEVEAQWKSVLEANAVTPKRKYFTTEDYIKLNNAMHLDEYSVSLTHYPWLEEFSPFKGWNIDNPTTSLNWYDAYNKVKHDREANFSEATLIHALNAVCASMIILFAQFGKQQATRWRHEIAYFFDLVETPKWCPSEVYTYPYEGHASGYSKVNCPLNANDNSDPE